MTIFRARTKLPNVRWVFLAEEEKYGFLEREKESIEEREMEMERKRERRTKTLYEIFGVS